MTAKFFSVEKFFPDLLSVAFRNYAAEHSHCRLVHGHDLSVRLKFAATTLDARNWVVDYGGLKEIKGYLEDTFDHKYIASMSDPNLSDLQKLEAAGILELQIVEAFSVEKLAEAIGEQIITFFEIHPDKHIRENVRLWEVTIYEGQKNSSTAHFDIGEIFAPRIVHAGGK